MARNSKSVGVCPKCEDTGGEIVCSYNFFDRDGLTIHSWEHKCENCGLRETTAYRSDEEDDDSAEDVDPAICPYCQRTPE